MDMTFYVLKCIMKRIPGLSSKAVRVSNSKHFSSDPCTYLYPDPRVNNSDPSSVSVLVTEGKNR